MFPLGYFESFQWWLPGPKATHGLLKGFFLILTAVLFTYYLLKRKAKSTEVEKSHIVLKILMLIFLYSYCISAFFSLSPESSFLNLWYPLISTAIIFSFCEIKLKKSFIQIFLVMSVLLILTTFIFAFFSLMFRYSVDNIYYFIFLENRANQLLGELRQSGKYVALGPYFMLLPLSLSFIFVKNANWSRKLLAFIIYLVSALMAVISNNRIDVLVLAIQTAVIVFLIPRKAAVIFLISLLPIIQFGLYTNEKYFGFSLVERITRPKVERDLETIDIRFTYWETALNNFRNYPLFGTGPNSYNDVSDFPFRKYYVPGTGKYTVKQDEGIGIHNVFYERLSDTGLFGFLTFISLLFYFFRKDGLSVLRIKDKDKRSQYILFALSSWSWILYGITDNGFGAQGFVVFFFLRGLIEKL